ncbi:MAG: glycosyltransferase [Verrucomicrobiae bacterium]|nr:glycosyltransferase [Verrucomicrobiae bacterium]
MVSILIPLRRDAGYLARCLESCFAAGDVEAIVLPDAPIPGLDPRARQEATGPVGPAAKRNRGAAIAKGEILAFVDDDTRLLAGWLAAALPHFEAPSVAAVGGPAITPKGDPFWARVSGTTYESWLVSGGERRRYLPGAPAEVDDWPSCNLLVRRTAFDAVGGFGTDFWPGEDTAFCLALVKRGWKIRYEPRAAIEHHRRPSLKKHFVQLANYGLHRGYFAKRFPETSLRARYFAPSALLLGLIALLAALLTGIPRAGGTLAALATAYLLLAAASVARAGPRLLLPSVGVIFISHLVYGAAFLRGLAAGRLPEEARPKIASQDPTPSGKPFSA